MPKNRNFGGEGGKDTTQTHYLKQKGKYYRSCGENYKLKPEELKDYLSGREIECLECGNWYRSISSHLYHSHRITKDDYCLKHGIPFGTPLVCSDLSNQMSNNQRDRISSMTEEEKEHSFSYLHKHRGEAYSKKTTAQCYKCQKEFEVVGARRGKQCPDCLRKSRSESTRKCQEKNKSFEELKCSWCKETFSSSNPHVKRKNKKGLPVYCSVACGSRSTASSRIKVYTKQCPECGKEFTVKKDKGTFCSRKCYAKSPLTKEAAKIRGKLGGQIRMNNAKRDEEGKFI